MHFLTSCNQCFEWNVSWKVLEKRIFESWKTLEFGFSKSWKSWKKRILMSVRTLTMVVATDKRSSPLSTMFLIRETWMIVYSTCIQVCINFYQVRMTCVAGGQLFCPLQSIGLHWPMVMTPCQLTCRPCNDFIPSSTMLLNSHIILSESTDSVYCLSASYTLYLVVGWCSGVAVR